jgi:spore germination cell wall hydrolase CwlJ-like protein
MIEAACLAVAIYWESRGEPFAGQVAVGQVILNRVNDDRWPDNICDVVMEGPVNQRGVPIRNRCQFSFYCDGLPDEPEYGPAWDTARRAAAVAVQTTNLSFDITDGATHYHATYVSPLWSDHPRVERTVRIGGHIFYKETRDTE